MATSPMTPLRGNAEQVFVSGAAGRIETVIDAPLPPLRGIALIGHPHPLYGGTLDNKVAQTLARTFAELGYVALRPNFRGVGESEGVHDQGVGETEDMLQVLDYAHQRYGELPVVLAGFSFGSYVQTRVAQQLASRGTPAERLVLVGTAAGRVSGEGEDRHYDTGAVPADTLVIHGDRDETVPLANVQAWAKQHDLAVHIVPDCDHFFHRKLAALKAIIKENWR